MARGRGRTPHSPSAPGGRPSPATVLADVLEAVERETDARIREAIAGLPQPDATADESECLLKRARLCALTRDVTEQAQVPRLLEDALERRRASIAEWRAAAAHPRSAAARARCARAGLPATAAAIANQLQISVRAEYLLAARVDAGAEAFIRGVRGEREAFADHARRRARAVEACAASYMADDDRHGFEAFCAAWARSPHAAADPAMGGAADAARALDDGSWARRVRLTRAMLALREHPPTPITDLRSDVSDALLLRLAGGVRGGDTPEALEASADHRERPGDALEPCSSWAAVRRTLAAHLREPARFRHSIRETAPADTPRRHGIRADGPGFVEAWTALGGRAELVLVDVAHHRSAAGRLRALEFELRACTRVRGREEQVVIFLPLGETQTKYGTATRAGLVRERAETLGLPDPLLAAARIEIDGPPPTGAGIRLQAYEVGWPVIEPSVLADTSPCAHPRGEWEPLHHRRSTRVEGLRLWCPDCLRARAGVVCTHQLPDGHPLLERLRGEAEEADAYLARRRFYAELDGERDAPPSLSVLRARDGIATLDPRAYTCGLAPRRAPRRGSPERQLAGRRRR